MTGIQTDAQTITVFCMIHQITDMRKAITDFTALASHRFNGNLNILYILHCQIQSLNDLLETFFFSGLYMTSGMQHQNRCMQRLYARYFLL